MGVAKQDALARIRTEGAGDVNREVAKQAEKIEERRRVAAKSKHDPLHNFDVFSCCWCLCSKCWHAYGRLRGRCICPECPCRRGFVPILTMAEMMKRRGNGI